MTDKELYTLLSLLAELRRRTSLQEVSNAAQLLITDVRGQLAAREAYRAKRQTK